MKSVLEMWSHDIVPVLLCATPGEKPLDYIATDERRLVNTAIEYLRHLGHQRIAYCGLHQANPRNQEMRRAFQTHGISLDSFLEEAYMTAPDHARADMHLDDFFRKPSPPTAVICFNDQMAAQLLLHAQRRGLRIPGDLSILGCSNEILCGYLTPELTSIESFPNQVGARAYELIQRRRTEGTAPGERVPETILIPPQLVIRESCGPPDPRRHAPVPQSPGYQLPRATLKHDEHTMEDTMEVSATLTRLLPLCVGPRSKRELMTQLGLHNEEHFRKAYLQPALQAGYLERTIPDTPRNRWQRYRLTAKGQALIKGEG